MVEKKLKNTNKIIPKKLPVKFRLYAVKLSILLISLDIKCPIGTKHRALNKNTKRMKQ